MALFLNCIEVSSQIHLLEILPKLYSENWENKHYAKLCCFNSWNVISCLNQQSIHKNLKMMCTSAASAVKLQCGREYTLRAVDVSLLNDSDLEGLPTNNLIAERLLSRFGRETNVEKSRKRRFNPKTFEATWYFASPKIKPNLTSCRIIIF